MILMKCQFLIVFGYTIAKHRINKKILEKVQQVGFH